MMAKVLTVAITLAVIGGLLVWNRSESHLFNPSPKQILEVKSRPLERYTVEALAQTDFAASQITLGKVLSEEADFNSYVFYFTVANQKVSGLANVPKLPGVYPVIVMFRGYVDRETYTMGTGTQRAGEVFAKAGFITLAPDFLGYGESDNPSQNPIEERFQTHTTALTLLASVAKLNDTLATNNLAARANSDKVGIWGHSNGGQIALTVLEITGQPYPTVLWAPVSKPFPYSVLYYTDDFDDRGKMLRRVIAEFERDYDVELYSLTNFFERVGAPLQIHQGTVDESVPLKWSDQLVETLEKLDKDVVYFTYFGADHNLVPSGWNLAVLRAVDFYLLTWERFKQ